jgi:hypothetical protein
MSMENILSVMVPIGIYIIIIFYCRKIAIKKNRDPVFWTGLAILLHFLILIILLCMPYRPKLEGDIRKIQTKK